MTAEDPQARQAAWTSYHVHSVWSDGADSIAELVAAAGGLNLAEIGISDHLVICSEGAEAVSWSLPEDRLDDYIAEVAEARRVASLPVRLGLEVDYFPAKIGTIRRLLEGRPFDYLIGSVHFIGDFPVDESERFWAGLSEDRINDICRQYWRLMKEMAETRLFHLAGHLDLVKKFGFRATADLSSDVDAALDALAGAGMAIELNTSGWSKPCREAYPSKDLLRQAVSRDIPVVITADAHRKMDLTRDFDRAAELLSELNVIETVRFADGKAIRTGFGPP